MEYETFCGGNPEMSEKDSSSAVVNGCLVTSKYNRRVLDEVVAAMLCIRRSDPFHLSNPQFRPAAFDRYSRAQSLKSMLRGRGALSRGGAVLGKNHVVTTNNSE